MKEGWRRSRDGKTKYRLLNTIYSYTVFLQYPRNIQKFASIQAKQTVRPENHIAGKEIRNAHDNVCIELESSLRISFQA